METIKWVFALLLAVTVLGILAAVAAATMAASAIVWAIALGIGVIWLTTRLIKELIDAHNEKIEDL